MEQEIIDIKLQIDIDFSRALKDKHPEKRDHVNGNINFVHGTRQFLSTPLITKKPELGKIFVFPNYLMHSVNPFYGEGERRSMSFNAYINDDVFDIYSQ